jgi:hypothetical protein
LDIESIPIEYGGEFEYIPGMTPKLDKGILEHLEWTLSGDRLPEGPIKWVGEQDKNRVVLATGSVGGEKRRKVLATLEGFKQTGGCFKH